MFSLYARITCDWNDSRVPRKSPIINEQSFLRVGDKSLSHIQLSSGRCKGSLVVNRKSKLMAVGVPRIRPSSRVFFRGLGGSSQAHRCHPWLHRSLVHGVGHVAAMPRAFSIAASQLP